jgi:hypothetical protein
MKVLSFNYTKDGHTASLCEKKLMDGSTVYDISVMDEDEEVLTIAAYDLKDANKRFNLLSQALQA